MHRPIYRDKKTIYAIAAGVFVLLFLALFIPADSSRMLAAAMLLPAAIITVLCIKKRSILSINKKEVLLLMSVIGVLYVILLYLTSLHFGVARSLGLSFDSAFRYLLPITVIIISIEIIRGVLLAQNDQATRVLSYLLCVVSEMLIFSNLHGLQTFQRFMDMLGLWLMPAIIANLLYHYLSRRYGCLPNIVYRLIITLYPYIFRYTPAMADTLLAFIKLIVPLIIWAFIDALYEKKRHYALQKKSKWSRVWMCALAVVMISIVMLISCQFRFGALVIATESMTGELNKGDAVIYERPEENEVQVGQVIVFEKDGSLIVHRVADIERINGINRYYTKGDANEDIDAGYILDVNIKGIAELKVPYIGYPTLWARALFSELRGD